MFGIASAGETAAGRTSSVAQRAGLGSRPLIGAWSLPNGGIPTILSVSASSLKLPGWLSLAFLSDCCSASRSVEPCGEARLSATFGVDDLEREALERFLA
jgi:hypothetical protein